MQKLGKKSASITHDKMMYARNAEIYIFNVACFWLIRQSAPHLKKTVIALGKTEFVSETDSFMSQSMHKKTA